ncbi:hypothetical protein [Phenylobacterium sp.]|uniref:terminase small subunit-like protein n=1 Tax=Phenylobacterium sp. TaxID=1871053 RepID=UPI002733E448|nr:hypothetical protein [Phenylobacterium sp.]MDP3854379.1 hypothetical protein [Phenylobacterium sp.]
MRKPKPPPASPVGPQKYVRLNRELAQRICDRIAQGESWSRMSGEPGMPSYATLYVWRKKYPAFGAQVEAAKLAGADWKFDQVWDIAQATPGEGVPQTKLKIDALRWQVGRRAAEAAAKAAECAKSAKSDADDGRVILNIRVVNFGDDDRTAGS